MPCSRLGVCSGIVMLALLFGACDDSEPVIEPGVSPVKVIEQEDPCDGCPGIYLPAWTPDACFRPAPSKDLDFDGVHDYCENALAAAFAPMMMFASDCDWDYSVDGGRMGGEYFWVVDKGRPRWTLTGWKLADIRIVYIPAYYRDCGTGAGIEEGFDDPHSGDSEFIIIDVNYSSTWEHWVTAKVFLSAHCGTSNDGQCKWFDPNEFHEWVDGRTLGAPFVWVSERKHANYRNADVCHSFLGIETCSPAGAPHRFPIKTIQQNAGSRGFPFPYWTGSDCVRPLSSSSMVSNDPNIVECFWDWEPQPGNPHIPPEPPLQRFNGWQDDTWGPAPMPYGFVLDEYAAFKEVNSAPGFSVYIEGPDEMHRHDTCTWLAQVYGGTSPYVYNWSGSLDGSGNYVMGEMPSPSGILFLDVWDSEDRHADSWMTIDVVHDTVTIDACLR